MSRDEVFPVPPSVLARIRPLVESEHFEEAVAVLRENGYSKIHSIKALKLAGLEQREAKSLVHHSSTWAGVRARDDDFHDRLFDALNEPEQD